MQDVQIREQVDLQREAGVALEGLREVALGPLHAEGDDTAAAKRTGESACGEASADNALAKRWERQRLGEANGRPRLWRSEGGHTVA